MGEKNTFNYDLELGKLMADIGGIKRTIEDLPEGMSSLADGIAEMDKQFALRTGIVDHALVELRQLMIQCRKDHGLTVEEREYLMALIKFLMKKTGEKTFLEILQSMVKCYQGKQVWGERILTLFLAGGISALTAWAFSCILN